MDHNSMRNSSRDSVPHVSAPEGSWRLRQTAPYRCHPIAATPRDCPGANAILEANCTGATIYRDSGETSIFVNGPRLTK
jgi:hypothetical protein